MKWREAAEMKNCSHYEHACKGKLSYHCVINPWQNATVEVCAPETQINAGYCAEYNRRGGKIQEFYKKSCENCVNEYISTEAYKYQECYRAVYKLRANKTKDMFKSNRILDSNNATQAMQEKDGSEQAFPSIGNYTGGHSFHVILLVCFLFVCLC
ncbi:uncharacterized protein LOC133178544 [Saccostrea echinata]|uniref:uncharacterized protein LOC133178544 n=1 Tax=Saccostrea echinata TaxID=191078 RepID=UPI002A7F9B27|nr:uncharacterized protein LOC133178544 [Saccostrea echinata]